MAKRGYKLQEFVAHGGNVNCLTFGKKNCRVFITGGDDQKVNLWSIGKPTSVMSLCGHTSPVESAAFDSAEVLVVAGSSSGAIKLWDLEETKMVRTLSGHRSYCTAVEFHPFGEFFASGSMDTNLKIWDIRKKGCIHTYKGHTRGISTIRFTPDGRWVVSGGFDNVVKVWDLTAGKLLHDFKFHEGHIRSIEFHPLEFLLATGSADKTVKFWDLETFELIGSTRREAAGVRSIAFHPDGRTLFCGLDDTLKVYSWEPVICHDSVDMGWSTLGDLCIHDGKLLGGAYYENFVAVWVADVSIIEPYGTRLEPEQYKHSNQKSDSEGSLVEKEESHIKSKPDPQFETSDSDSKEIKTIYVDRVSSVTSKDTGSVSVPKIIHLSDSKEISTPGTQKRGSATSLPAKPNPPSLKSRSIAIPTILPHDGPDGKDLTGSRRESMASSKTSSGMSVKSAHTRRLLSSRIGTDRMSVSSMPCENVKSSLGSKKDAELRNRLVSDENAKESSEGSLPTIQHRLAAHEHAKVSSDTEQSDIETVRETSDRTSPVTVSGDQTQNSSKGVNPVKVVNGVTVVHGRTRSLVEKFERQELFYNDEDQSTNKVSGMTGEPLGMPSAGNTGGGSGVTAELVETPPDQMPIRVSDVTAEPPENPAVQKSDRGPSVTAEPLETPPIQKPDLGSGMTAQPLETPAIQKLNRGTGPTSETLEPPVIQKPNRGPSVTAEPLETPPIQKPDLGSGMTAQPLETRAIQKLNRGTGPTSETLEPPVIQKPNRGSSVTVEPPPFSSNHRFRRLGATAEPLETPPAQKPGRSSGVIAGSLQIPLTQRRNRRSSVIAEPPITIVQKPDRMSGMAPEPLESPLSPKCDRKVVAEEATNLDDVNAIENLMQNRDTVLSTLKSRLTKLQVVRHFWERNDVKGAINAVRKLPDHSIQADVIAVLIERLEMITLDLFSCLLPMLLGLLESKTDRHATVSLEMLLKLVAVFGATVHSTVSAPPGVGVDLHAEERRECCKQCFAHLQDIQRTLPQLVKRGGFIARYTQQLNLILQQNL